MTAQRQQHQLTYCIDSPYMCICNVVYRCRYLEDHPWPWGNGERIRGDAGLSPWAVRSDVDAAMAAMLTEEPGAGKVLVGQSCRKQAIHS